MSAESSNKICNWDNSDIFLSSNKKFLNVVISSSPREICSSFIPLSLKITLSPLTKFDDEITRLSEDGYDHMAFGTSREQNASCLK